MAISQMVQHKPSVLKVKTRTDSKFQSTKDLFVTAARVGDVVDIMNEYDKIVRSSSSSRSKMQKQWSNVRRLVVPFLSNASKEISTSARVLAPMPEIQILQTRGDSAIKRELACDPKYDHYTTTSEKLLSHHLCGRRSTDDDKMHNPPTKRSRIEASIITSTMKKKSLLPESDTPFNKLEVVKIVTERTKYKTSEHSETIHAIIEHQKKFGVLVSYRGISRLVETFEKTGKLPIGEFGRGRTPYAYASDIISIAEHCDSQPGRTFTRSDISDKIQEKHKERLVAAGIQPLVQKDMDARTVGRYFVQVADHCNISIAEKAIPKTNTRDAAENSLRAAVATLGIIGSTHLFPVDKLDEDLRKEMKNLPEDTTMMMDMMSRVFGCPVYPVRPEYIFSSDETTEYIYEGTKTKTDQFVLTSKKSIAKRATSSLFRVQNDKSMNGMRVKLTFTFSAIGTCMPLVCTVAGLTEREMPNGDEFIHVKIPGLCVGGGGVNINNKEFGHLLLMRDTVGAAEKKFKWYHDEVLIPGIKAQRKHFAGFDSTSGEPVPDNLTAVSWCDGDLSQVKAITDSADELTANKIIANKQHAARSAVEQPADLANVFNVIKKNQESAQLYGEGHIS